MKPAQFLKSSAWLVRAALVPLAVFAMPTSVVAAVSGEDALRFQELTTVTDDWSYTAMFDLERYVSVKAKVSALHIPRENGYVVIAFTLLSPRLSGQQSYRAIIASKEEWQRQKLTSDVFYDGQEVILHGWPQSSVNGLNAMMLTDQIYIPETGKRLSFVQVNNRASESRSTGSVPGKY